MQKRLLQQGDLCTNGTWDQNQLYKEITYETNETKVVFNQGWTVVTFDDTGTNMSVMTLKLLYLYVNITLCLTVHEESGRAL